MTQVELVRLLQRLVRDHKKRVFTLREIASLAGISQPAAGMILLRAERKGLVSRVTNCWFDRLNPPELLELAFSLVSPSYLSFESALYHHGILSQSPRGALTLATTERPRKIETPLGNIQFIHLKPSLFFGYDAHRVAYPEKAWLDFLYIHRHKDATYTPTVELYEDRLNRKQLHHYGKKFPKWLQRELLLQQKPEHKIGKQGER